MELNESEAALQFVQCFASIPSSTTSSRVTSLKPTTDSAFLMRLLVEFGELVTGLF